MVEFATFIASNSGGSGFGAWHRHIAFGETLPGGRCSGLVHLDVDNIADAKLFAAFGGKLSVVQPTGFLQPTFEVVGDDVPASPTITLYLEPVAAKFGVAWSQVSDRIIGQFQSNASEAAKLNVLAHLVYHNVDAGSAQALLIPRLKTAGPRGATDNQLWKRFLAGEGPIVLVGPGDQIGIAGSLTTGASRRVAVGLRIAFGMYDPGQFYADIVAVLGSAAPADADALSRGPLQSQRPLIGAGRTPADVGADRLWPWSALLQYKKANTLTYSAWRALGNAQKTRYLAQLLARARPGLAPSTTPRFVYDVDDMSNVFQLESVVEFYANFPEPWDPAAQPVTSGSVINFLGLYGLDARAAGSDVTLDDQLDMKRIMPGRDTIVLDADSGRPSRQYRIVGVDRGSNLVTLDAAPQFSAGSAWRIFHTPTLAIIDAFGSRVRGARAVNVAANVLELRGLTKVQLDALAQVNKFETIDLLDAGQGAEHAARLTAIPELDRTNNKATVRLDRALAASSAGNAWAIPSGVGGVQQTSVDVVFQDHGKVFPGPQILTPTKAASVWGFDQYDGVMFMIACGEIRCHFPWTSYTSRALSSPPDRPPPAGVPANFHSSIKGNAVYRYGSAFSTNDYINAGFRVVDPDGFLWADDAAPLNVTLGNLRRVYMTFGSDAKVDFVKGRQLFFLWPVPPRFRPVVVRAPAKAEEPNPALDDLFLTPDAEAIPPAPAPYWIFVHPGVRQARYYFTDGLDPDVCPPNQLPTSADAYQAPGPSGDDQLGKSGIFIHKGEQTRCGSEGCQVSPAFMSLRVAMMVYDAEANAMLYSDAGAKPRFQTEVHWEQHRPALLQNFLDLKQELVARQKELKQKMADPLLSAVNAVLAKKGNKPELAALAKQIERAKAQSKGAQDAGEGPTQQEVIDTLQAILDGAADKKVQDLLKDEQSAREIALAVPPLRQTVKELAAKIQAEIASYGWNDAIHGEYWVIRPDERFE